ncbi:hypothetical protein IQ227_13515 [Anabaena aphanizomenioides LEGE 00250]|jgi:hypothetical protein|uniref:Uncharacterized protein n=1 Tax=Sphaerospermopsis aphanizomenoides LEGE 00250 TaxID=2777972 RepID=A0ABR9VEV5_9CYAN|nr:hypothetical protein [Sphaerospermopsis aphanizomenoides]MBE9237016.1 hypothetical protein [Sphaerospermopsis aphanizomenoides LEGE 00250]
MAWIFSLSAECGDKKSAEVLAIHFRVWFIPLETDEKYHVCVDTFQDIENNWWCRVYSDNISCIGIDSVKTANLMTELGFLFYKHLRLYTTTLPRTKFRYALVGVEVDEFRTYSELIEDLPNLSIPGLVLSTELTQGLETLSGFQEFSSGYIWQPYKGEVYHPSMALQT